MEKQHYFHMDPRKIRRTIGNLVLVAKACPSALLLDDTFQVNNGRRYRLNSISRWSCTRIGIKVGRSVLETKFEVEGQMPVQHPFADGVFDRRGRRIQKERLLIAMVSNILPSE